MSKYEDENKIWDELKASLQEHEEPYQEGAWEKFQAWEKSRTVPVVPLPSRTSQTRPLLFWMRGVAAALLVVAGTWFLWPSQESVQKTAGLPVSDPVGLDLADIPFQNPSIEVEEIEPNLQEQETIVSYVRSPVPSEKAFPAEIDQPIMATLQVDRPLVHARTLSVEEPVRQNQNLLTSASVYETVWVDSTEPSKLEIKSGDGYLLSELGQKVEDPWQYGFQFNSSVTTDRMNYGGGVQVAYRLTDKVSVNSGLSIGKMGVNRAKGHFLGHVAARIKGESVDVAEIEQKNVNNGIYMDSGPQGAISPGKGLSATMLPTYHNRTLLGSTSEVVVLDIPLDVKVNWTRNLYTSVGVSFVGILNETRYNYYQESFSVSQRQEASSLANPPQNLKYDIQTTTVKNLANTQPLEGKQFVSGYFNLSIGRQVPVRGNFKLGVEPFLKVPMGNLRRSEMNFTNVGLRLVSGF